MSCKSNNGKTYLMQFIIKNIYEQCPDLLSFIDDLYENIQTCRTFNLDGKS